MSNKKEVIEGVSVEKQNAEIQEKYGATVLSIKHTIKAHEEEAKQSSLELYNINLKLKTLKEELERLSGQKVAINKRLEELSIIINLSNKFDEVAAGNVNKDIPK